MADKRKPSKVLADTLGIPGDDYAVMDLNARRYERTEAGVEDAILKQIFERDDTQETLLDENVDPAYKKYLYKSLAREYGKTKKLSATEILKAINQPYDKEFDKGRYDTPEQKLIDLYDANPNHIRNVLRADKDFGKAGAENLDAVVYNLKEREKDLKARDPKLATKILMPRVAESVRAGRKPSTTDYTLDIVENGLMALPFGTALKGYRAGNLAKNALGLAAEIAAVPTIMEGIDAYSYDEFTNPERADFNPIDVGLYAGTNLIAPWVMNRVLNRAGKLTGVGKSAPVLESVTRQDDAAVKALADDLYTKKVAGINEAKLWEDASDAARKRYGKEFILGDEDPIFDQLVRQSYSTARKEADAEAAAIVAKQLADEANKQARVAGAKSIAKDVLGSWATNKLGRQSDANQFLGRFTSGLSQYMDSDVPTIVKQMREEHAEDARNRARTSYAQQVLGQDTLSEEDKEWLGKIAAKPDIVRGFGEGATSEFKNWYLTRGMDLLRGSDVFRPAYDVK